MNFVTDYTTFETDGRYYSFIGMNTGKGFAGSYDIVIAEKDLKRLYIIKGAAGTGKSTIMRKCAEEAEANGKNVRYYLCGSDVDSVDCVVIDGKIAILDGTPPHSFEMRYGGAVSELLDTTRCWNSENLGLFRADIIKLNDTKRETFGDAYSLLNTVSLLASQRLSYAERAVDRRKLEAFVSRFIQSLGKPKGKGTTDELILRSIGMKGLIRLDTLEREAKRIFAVKDMYSSAFVLMKCIHTKLSLAGFDTVISRDPAAPDNICEIYIPHYSVLITVENTEHAEKIINMARFVNKSKLSRLRGTLRLSYSCTKMLLAEAVRLLAKGGEAHFALEKIYSSSMDYDALNKLTRSAINEMGIWWE